MWEQQQRQWGKFSIVETIEPQPRRSVQPRHFPGVSQNSDGCHVVNTVSSLKRVEKVSPVIIQMIVFEVDGVSF